MIKIKINTSGAAFDDGNKEVEVARILRQLAYKIEYGGQPGKIMDTNGNAACTIKYEEEDTSE